MKPFRCANPNAIAVLFCMLPAAAQAATPTHCLPEEQVIFSCSVGKKVVSMCATRALDPESGTAQYRFGAVGRIELKIPAQPQHPKTFSQLGVMRGWAWDDTHLRVVNGEYAYTLYAVAEEGRQRSGVLVSKQGRTLSNFSCVSPRQGFLADVAYFDRETFADEAASQKEQWREAMNATKSEGSEVPIPQLDGASSGGKMRSERGKDFVLDAAFDPGFLLPVAASSGCAVDSPPRYSVQASFGTIHVDEYKFPYGCFGTTKANALFGVGFVVPEGGSAPLGFRYRKGGRAELLNYLQRL